MRVFKTKWFTRFAKKEGITDQKLLSAVAEIERGLVDAELGGGLVKKRVLRKGQGKRGGFRTILAYREKELSVFLYGFPKSSRSNLNTLELETYQRLAKIFFGLSAKGLEKAVSAQELEELASNVSEKIP